MASPEKFRKAVSFKGEVTVTGSTGLNGAVQVNTAIRLGGPVTAPTGSSNSQRFGMLRINSGATTATHSTTALASGALLMVGAATLVGAPVASYNLVGELVVNTIAQASSGGYFTVGFAGSNAYAANLDVPWFIINPA